MPAQSHHSAVQNQAIYQATIDAATAGGGMLMGKLVESARLNLQTRQAATRDLRERDALEQSVNQLRRWEPTLTRHFPKILLGAFSKPLSAPKAPVPSSANLEFDQLELMDEVQVLTSVALARVQQVTLLVVEASLTEFNTLICSALGLGAVHPERNPLRPEVYIQALKEVVEQTKLPASMQLDWLGAMSSALGIELRQMYVALSAKLRSQGVVAAGYAVLQTPLGSGIGRGIAQGLEGPPVPVQGSPGPTTLNPPRNHASGGPMAEPIKGRDSVLLTLDKLRQLLTGELDAHAGKSSLEIFSQRFAREFEGDKSEEEPPVTDFDATVPAALEALNEMRQVDHMVQRLQSRRAASAPSIRANDNSIEALRSSLRGQAGGVSQALSLEVVTLMVDNIARDIRLLESVQGLVRKLEAPLLRLALVDQRLFTNKQHPARVLIREITERSLAFAMENAPGFGGFMHGVEQGVAPLLVASIDNAEPFERALMVLREQWLRVEREGERQRKGAVEVLLHAEERNLLAEKIAREIDSHPDAALVAEVVVNFLCGPWSQVVAQARLTGGPDSAQADKYQALISALLWSTHPTLTHKKYSKLTRLVPLLLTTLREGLDSIHYPATKTSAFLEALMGLHQKAFRAAQKPAEAAPIPAPAPRTSAQVRLVETGDPWVAPEEAEVSNFMELPDGPAESTAPTSQDGAVAYPTDSAVASGERDAASGVAPSFGNLPLGSWAEMLVNGQWVRTQLTWASPHGTLFLFTSAYGTSQSMTRRSRDKMIAAGNLRLVSGQPVVEGALNAVAQTAMRNSVETTF